mmetsp:Transcript_16726/g.16408  ORF Transcript_16726/g.16408 Transcript_16726/m.16408 type:complete len:220 (+) Transcript_16726:220-879(+)
MKTMKSVNFTRKRLEGAFLEMMLRDQTLVLLKVGQHLNKECRGFFKGLTMRKATNDTEQKKEPSLKTLVKKKPKQKLNSSLLKEHDNQQKNQYELPSIELRIPEENYIEDITELNDIESCPEAINRYLEKKYLSQKFLESSTSELIKIENEFISGLKFEFMVNKILESHNVAHKWYYPIHSFVEKIVRTIKPNLHLPNEVVHFKDYVTIRKVKWMNHLK